MSSAPLLYPGY
ncbi:hypothetical protein Avbf_18987 [Armadillidium vulgare]|nr:hypothetical protein Avbf_18987 [Armadillidium vulgare]